MSKITQFIVVSSGAVGLGMGKLGINQRPKVALRACASVGQCLLMNAWSQSLEKKGLIASQVLLTVKIDNRNRTKKFKKLSILSLIMELFQLLVMILSVMKK